MGEVTPGTLSSPRIKDAIQEPGRQAVRHHWSFISSENLISAFDVPTLFSYSRDHAFTAYKKREDMNKQVISHQRVLSGMVLATGS